MISKTSWLGETGETRCWPVRLACGMCLRLSGNNASAECEMSESGEYPDVQTQWVQRLRDLLIPVLQHRIERLGIERTGAYNFYSARVQQGDVFSDYDVALTQKLLSSGLDIREVHEIGCGFGQLVFLLAWNGFKVTGFEADRGRAQSARDLLAILKLTDPELTKSANLLEGEFPSLSAPPPDAHTLVLTTNLVATRNRSQQLAVLQAMRKYPFVLADVQRFFDLKPDLADEPGVLAFFAEAGLKDGKLFLDMGPSGRYYLFATPD